MFKKIFRQVINECFNEIIYEGRWFEDSTHPEARIPGDDHHVGGHSPSDSTEPKHPVDDRNGANFNGEHIIVSENRFVFYAVKHFNNNKLKGSMDIFNGTVGLRRALDTVYGGAKRNGRSIIWRSITPEAHQKEAAANNYMSYSFWEFSFDHGKTWYILKPRPLQTLKLSTFVKV